MPFPLPANAENVGAMVALGIIEGLPDPFQFDGPLAFPAGSAEGTIIASVVNPVAGETYSILPANGKVKWVGSQLQVGPTASAAPTTITYTLGRDQSGRKFADVFDVLVDTAGTPAGALDKQVDGLAALNGSTMSHNSATGHVVVRVAGRNGGGVDPNITVTRAGVSMTRVGEVHDLVAGNPCLAFFVIRGAATGAQTIEIACDAGVGAALVRVGDLATLSASYLGNVASLIDSENNIIDLNIDLQTPGSLLLNAAIWGKPAIGGVLEYQNSTLQWYGETVTQDGPELIVNGDFSSATGWSMGSGWSVAGGKAIRAPLPASANIIRSVGNLPAHRAYKHSFTIEAVTGLAYAYLSPDWPSSGPARNSIATHTQVINTSTTGSKSVGVTASSNAALTIDSMSFKEQIGTSAAFYTSQSTAQQGTYSFTWEPAEGQPGPCAALVVELKGATLP